MDATAISLCMDNKLPIVVFNIRRDGNIRRIDSWGTDRIGRFGVKRMTDKQIIERVEKKMSATLQDARHKLAAVRTGRASLSMFDGVMVDYYGTMTPLNQVAKLSVPDPSMVVAQPFDPSTLPAIEKAILAADLGLNPANDGKLVRIPIPSLTEERRKQLVKKVQRTRRGGQDGGAHCYAAMPTTS